MKLMFLTLFCIFTRFLIAQNEYVDSFDNVYNKAYRTRVVNLSLSGDAYNFMALRDHYGGLMRMYKTTKKQKYLDELVLITDNILSTSKTSSDIANSRYKFKDSRKGWISLSKRGDVQFQEVPLFESYIFRYIVEVLYDLKKSELIHDLKWQQWFNTTLVFFEENVWLKWYERSEKESKRPYRIFLRSRTHMGSHWAGMALLIQEISNSEKIKIQAGEVIRQYDKILKNNLKKNPTNSDAFTWNMTYDNVMDTQADPSSVNIIQDVSHANHVISYIVLAHQLNPKVWTRSYIDALVVLNRDVLFRKTELTFQDNLDSSITKGVRASWGNNVGDGWLLLAQFDADLYNAYVKVLEDNNSITRRYNQLLNYRAGLAMAKMYLLNQSKLPLCIQNGGISE